MQRSGQAEVAAEGSFAYLIMAVTCAKEKPFVFSDLISLHKSWLLHKGSW